VLEINYLPYITVDFNGYTWAEIITGNHLTLLLLNTYFD
jgi:hypothetical protein